MEKKVILLTNDDGIQAPGLQFLYQAVKDLGPIRVCAPLTNQSAASHSFTLRKPIKVCRLRKDWFGVAGTPTDAVLISYHGLFQKKIKLVISGINDSPNLGEDVLYSGTVAAAIEGTILGIPSFAISVLNKKSFQFSEEIKEIVVNLVKEITRRGLPKKTFLNVNIPDQRIKGIRITTLGKRIYRDMAIKTKNERNEVCYIIDGSMDYLPHRGTDFEAVYSGYVSITPLHLDMTHYQELRRYQKRFEKLFPSA
jgi:5'-nucleotidase|uniref:5'-nucleotidase SurE n=1 Tax=candidate division WOR-3 bacterium TaxID=2052148 RepID=A0A7C3UV03_UNCW3